MRRYLLSTIASCGLFMGCLDTGVNEISPSESENLADKPKLAMASQAAALTVPITSPHRYSFVSVLNGTQGGDISVEKDHYCGTNEVVTGFGARVSNGNVTGILLQCALVSDGRLVSRRTTTSGGTPIEATVYASPGYVVVGVGGVVNNSGFRRAVISECQWLDGLGFPPYKVGSCRNKSSDGYTDAESFVFAAGLGGRAVTGIGLSAGYEALKAVEVRVGHLVGTLLNQRNLYGVKPEGSQPGSEWRTWFESPGWAKHFAVVTYGGTGNSDLYVRDTFDPTSTTYYAASTSPSTNDQTDMVPPGGNIVQWRIFLSPTTTFSGVSLKAYVWE